MQHAGFCKSIHMIIDYVKVTLNFSSHSLAIMAAPCRVCTLQVLVVQGHKLA